MVYCGVPSKACAPCRGKRTKCDLGKPLCSQCKRTGRNCGGYRDNSDLQIRDQTQSIAAKHSRNKCKELDTISITSKKRHNSKDSTKVIYVSQYPHNIPLSLSVPPSDGAACFLFSEYVLEDSMDTHNLFDALPTLYTKATPGSAISNAIIAVGMACLSNAMNAPELLPLAESSYVEAIRLTNSALGCPLKSKVDETLMLVLLLGLYEENRTTSHSLDPWTNHVNGAIALLNYRGPSQLQSHTGLKLISALRTQIIVNALVRRTPVPRSILHWSHLAQQHEIHAERSESELSSLIATYCNLQSDIYNFSQPQTSTSIISRALQLDTTLANWAEKYEIENLYTIQHTKASPEIYKRTWHAYTDIGLATVCNYYRSIRILIHQILISNLTPLITHSSPVQNTPTNEIITQQITTSKSIIISLSEDICYTVPSFLCFPPSLVKSDTKTIPTPNRAHAKLLLWPIFVSAQTSYVTDELRDWVISRLEIIANVIGGRKVGVLIEVLREGSGRRVVWRGDGGGDGDVREGGVGGMGEMGEMGVLDVPEEAWFG